MIFKVLCLVVGLAAIENALSSRIQQIHGVFRHGQRTPASTYPLDPYTNDTFSPYGRGQLTDEGKRNMLEMGKWLRDRYDRFLGDQFSPEYFKVMTTDVDRTKASAQLVLKGLFPDAPVVLYPTSHQNRSEDNLLLVTQCQRFTEAFEKAKNEAEDPEKTKDQSSFYKYVEEHTGMPIKDCLDIFDVYGTLEAEEQLKLKLPEWTKSVYPGKMREESGRCMNLLFKTDEVKRIRGGPLLKKILQDSRDKSERKSDVKLYLYAGHDMTVTSLLQALNVWEDDVTDYGTLVLLEIRRDGRGDFVKVYEKNLQSRVEELEIPECGRRCYLSELEKLSGPVMPSDLEKECKPQDPAYNASAMEP